MIDPKLLLPRALSSPSGGIRCRGTAEQLKKLRGQLSHLRRKDSRFSFLLFRFSTKDETYLEIINTRVAMKELEEIFS